MLITHSGEIEFHYKKVLLYFQCQSEYYIERIEYVLEKLYYDVVTVVWEFYVYSLKDALGLKSSRVGMR